MLTIDKAKTALLVMDFQNDIVDPQGAFGSQGMAAQVQEKKAIENTARALAVARNKGMLVVHVGVAFRKGHPEIGPGAPLFQGIKQANALLEGSWGADFHPGVRPAEGEVVVIKRGVSALARTDLDLLLRGKGITTLVLTGIATNFVIEGTARHAVDEGYQVVVLKDCCASFNDQMHTFSLQILSQLSTAGTVEEFVTAVS
jgi:nicotinamidase-related amidase